MFLGSNDWYHFFTRENNFQKFFPVCCGYGVKFFWEIKKNYGERIRSIALLQFSVRSGKTPGSEPDESPLVTALL